MGKIPTRDEAYTLLLKYNQNESLIRHALAVEEAISYESKSRK